MCAASASSRGQILYIGIGRSLNRIPGTTRSMLLYLSPLPTRRLKRITRSGADARILEAAIQQDISALRYE
jgi:hypothetical protein